MVVEQLKQQYKFSFREFSIVGKRSRNEDRTLIVQDQPWHLMLLADGMGGHNNGDIAAEEALALISSKFLELNEKAIVELNSIFQSTNQIINDSGAGSGTTIGGVFVRSGFLDVFWAGDVRIYITSQRDKFQFVSRDHTLIRLMKESNSPIKPTEIDRMRNTVTRSLGLSDKGWEPELATFVFSRDITGFICSDGVHSMISDDEIFSLLKSDDVEEDFNHIMEKLKLKASDNASAIFFACQSSVIDNGQR